MNWQISEKAPGSVFVTARFRSGSTLFWKLLREHKQITAYYEPLNPRRWFDPALRGHRVDSTHTGVEEYWTEYDLFADSQVPWEDWWPSRDLYLTPAAPARKLYEYFALLINGANGLPVLQCNRLDFRLEWLKRRFPESLLIHLHRNPRDQWLSTFLNNPSPPLSATVSEWRHYDEFYLIPWAKDLSHRLPLLSEVDDLHPYELSYLIWRLSFVYASNYADLSISYESLVADPSAVLSELGEAIHQTGLEQAQGVAAISSRSVGRWKAYAEHDWFQEREKRCDLLLEQCVFGKAPAVIECIPS